MNVSAVLVTRGDVDLSEIIDSLTAGGIEDIVVWDNSERDDLAVYGRYAAIAEAKHDLVLAQDDDVVLPPESIEALMTEWEQQAQAGFGEARQASFESGKVGLGGAWLGEAWQGVVCNMPEAWRRQPFYSDHALIGFGAVFHRDLPVKAFKRFDDFYATNKNAPLWTLGFYWRTCDIVFTALTPRVLVDVPYENLPWAEDETRMYRSEGHVTERTRMLDLVRKVRDA